MSWHIMLIVILVTAASLATTMETSEQCTPHMFGRDCAYQCRCTNNSLCHPDTGNCTSGDCQPGYTPPSCQYVNNAYNAIVDTSPIFGDKSTLGKVVDGKAVDCIAQLENTNETLTIRLHHVLWADAITVLLYEDFLRQSTRAKAKEIEITYTTLDRGNVTADNHQFRRDDLLITSRLPQPTLVSQVHIRSLNEKSLAICEVSVSSGRNLIYKNAADSATTGNSSMCQIDQSMSSYTVDVGRAHVWQLKMSSTDGVRVNVTLGDGSEKEVNVMSAGNGFLTLAQPMNASRVTLWTASSMPELCEAVVYGVCQPGAFGRQCKQKCDCAQTCDELNGDCSSAAGSDCIVSGKCSTTATSAPSGGTTLKPVVWYPVIAALLLSSVVTRFHGLLWPEEINLTL